MKEKKHYIIASVFIAIYLIVQIFPPLWVLDSTSLRHFLFAIINLFSITYILFFFKPIKRSHLLNPISIAWYVLIFFMCISMFQSFNLAESLLTLNRWLIVFFLFIYLSYFLENFPKLIDFTFKITLFIALFNFLSLIIPYYYLETYKTGKISMLNGFYGNKNIFAVAVLFKLPLLYYGCLRKKGFYRYASAFLIIAMAFSIVVLSARASFIGLFLQLFVLSLFLIIYMLRNKNRKTLAISLSLILISSIFGVVLGDGFVNYNYKKYKAKEEVVDVRKENKYSFSNRWKSIEEKGSSGRNVIWNNTISLIKEKPLTGHGVGVHKIAIMKHEAAQKRNFVVSDHAHNDYLEMFSELGIFGLLAYISIYITAFILFLLTQISRKNDLSTKIISLLGFLTLITYMNDAMFNFPLERADAQLYLAFSLAMILFSYYRRQDKGMGLRKWVIILIGLVSIPIAYFETLHFVSSIMQKQRTKQMNGSLKVWYSGDEWLRRFPRIPNIDEGTRSIPTNIAAVYAREGKYREAIDLIIDDRSNPYNGLREYRLANFYYKLGKPDSVEYYSRQLMRMKPKSYYPINLLFRQFKEIGEFEKAEDLILEYVDIYPMEAKAWRDIILMQYHNYEFEKAEYNLERAKDFLPNHRLIRDIGDLFEENE